MANESEGFFNKLWAGAKQFTRMASLKSFYPAWNSVRKTQVVIGDIFFGSVIKSVAKVGAALAISEIVSKIDDDNHPIPRPFNPHILIGVYLGSLAYIYLVPQIKGFITYGVKNKINEHFSELSMEHIQQLTPEQVGDPKVKESIEKAVNLVHVCYNLYTHVSNSIWPGLADIVTSTLTIGLYYNKQKERTAWLSAAWFGSSIGYIALNNIFTNLFVTPQATLIEKESWPNVRTQCQDTFKYHNTIYLFRRFELARNEASEKIRVYFKELNRLDLYRSFLTLLRNLIPIGLANVLVLDIFSNGIQKVEIDELTLIAYFMIPYFIDLANFANAIDDAMAGQIKVDVMVNELSENHNPKPPQFQSAYVPPNLAEGESLASFSNVSFAYPNRPEDIILDDISFDIKQGTSTAIVGQSGCGKSTIFKILLKLISLNNLKGDVCVLGKNIKEYTDDEIIQTISMLPQQIQILEKKNLQYNVCYGSASIDLSKPLSNDEEHFFSNAIKKSGLNYLFFKLVDSPIKQSLSGGQSQRIGIARLHMSRPRIYLLDEPTAALDPHVGYQVMNDFFSSLPKTSAALIITHDYVLAQRCDQVVSLGIRREDKKSVGYVNDKGSPEQLSARLGLFGANCRVHAGKPTDNDIKLLNKECGLSTDDEIEIKDNKKIEDNEQKNEQKEEVSIRIAL